MPNDTPASKLPTVQEVAREIHKGIYRACEAINRDPDNYEAGAFTAEPILRAFAEAILHAAMVPRDFKDTLEDNVRRLRRDLGLDR